MKRFLFFNITKFHWYIIAMTLFLVAFATWGIQNPESLRGAISGLTKNISPVAPFVGGKTFYPTDLIAINFKTTGFAPDEIGWFQITLGTTQRIENTYGIALAHVELKPNSTNQYTATFKLRDDYLKFIGETFSLTTNQFYLNLDTALKEASKNFIINIQALNKDAKGKVVVLKSFTTNKFNVLIAPTITIKSPLNGTFKEGDTILFQWDSKGFIPDNDKFFALQILGPHGSSAIAEFRMPQMSNSYSFNYQLTPFEINSLKNAFYRAVQLYPNRQITDPFFFRINARTYINGKSVDFSESKSQNFNIDFTSSN